MSNDHIQELLGRYATGVLTEHERAILFEAALKDQSLFEELAAEHELKQLLEQPGARERMLRALAPPNRQKASRWLWIAGSAAAAGVAVIVGIALLRPPAPKQIAQARKEFAFPATASIPTLPTPVIQSAPPVLKASKQASGIPPVVQPEPAIAGVPPPPPSANAVKESVARLAAPSPAPMVAPSAAGFRALNQFTAVAPVNGFGFSYAVTPNLRLRVTPAAAGFVSVRASNGVSSRSLADNVAAQPQSVSEFEIPADSTVLTVIFSARQIPAGEVQAGLAGTLDGLSGAKVDPNPSPDSRLTAIIPIKPGAVR